MTRAMKINLTALSSLLVISLAGVLAASFSAAASASGGQARAAKLSPIEELGKKLFFDTRLSVPEGQACAACHGPEVGGTGPDEAINKAGAVYKGAQHGRFGNRKPPASSYAGESPVLYRDKEGKFVGGMFWDGRATGEILGDPMAEQAMGPFLNPLEQNVPDKASLVRLVKSSSYAGEFEKVWGPGSLDLKNPESAYEKIARSIAAYERSAEANPFSSKFDAFWRKAKAAGLAVENINASNWTEYENLGLDKKELQGLMLFATKGLCANCHVLTSAQGKPPVFTDYTYDNLGVPRNPDLPFYAMGREWNPDGKDWVDRGLGDYLETVKKYAPYARENYGRHKVPTVRNADKRPRPDFVKAYMHNGCFKSLKEVVHFYNTRDVAAAKWPKPEVAANVNKTEMGDLGLTDEEEDLIVLFMQTLTDQ